jgi:ubiquitin-conjugating enzyme E2 S
MGDDLTQLTILLTGAPGTPYDDGVWKLNLRIPQDYPKSPPKAYFRTKIWHPNVEESTGSVCLDTLKRDWQAKLTLRDILITISCLLINPNPDSALNAGAGKLLQEDWDAFSQHAKLMTSIHASIPSNLKAAVSEAKGRGEEQIENEPVPAQPDTVYVDAESEDETENGKENDASLSPSPVDPHPPASIHRPTVLGKRPLGELPTPEEPPSEDEEEDNSLTHSERNIVANTPNLSNNLASFGFSSELDSTVSMPELGICSRQTPKLVERLRGTNFTRPVLTSRPCEATRVVPCSAASVPSRAKRVCSEEGKENENGSEQVPSLASQPKPAPLIGLGVKASSASVPVSRMSSVMGATKMKPKPRVGMRRL